MIEAASIMAAFKAKEEKQSNSTGKARCSM